MKRTICVLILFLVSIPWGCAHIPVTDGLFKSDTYGFSIPLPGEPFSPIGGRGAIFTLMHGETGATIALFVSDDTYQNTTSDGVDLVYIVRELFFFIDKKAVLKSGASEMGGNPAWYMEVSGEVAGESLFFAAYVTRWEERIYDMVLWSAPEDFDEMKTVLHMMVSDFQFLPGGDR
jgi:hypothetical protein